MQRLTELKENIAQAVLESYDSLYDTIVENQVHVSGRLNVLDSKGTTNLGSFDVVIKVSQDFPGQLPDVYEIGGRIPKIADRHINPKGETCLFNPVDRHQWFIFDKDTALKEAFLQFMKIFVHNFFLGQLYYERFNKWPGKEWRHGILGIYDACLEKYNLASYAKNGSLIRLIVSKKFRPYKKCFCGSHKSLRDCHFRDLKAIRSRLRHRLH